jgi:hypothetical protein
LSRATIIIRNDDDRIKAASWCRRAPDNTRIEFKASKRSIPQNARFYAMLTDVAQQATHAGRKYTVDEWKALFMHGCGKEMEFVPSLSGNGFLPLGYRSSELTKDEMTELMEFMAAWGAENGVIFRDTPPPPSSADARAA